MQRCEMMVKMESFESAIAVLKSYQKVSVFIVLVKTMGLKNTPLMATNVFSHMKTGFLRSHLCERGQILEAIT